MGLLQNIYATWTNDPYHVSPDGMRERFTWKRTYTWQTDFGFHFRYEIVCEVRKIDWEGFKQARMLEQSNQHKLIDTWHTEIFLRYMKELLCSFRFVMTPRGIRLDENPCLCRIVNEGGSDFVFYDYHCRGTTDDIQKLPFQRNGCEVKLWWMTIIFDDLLLKENYNMIKMKEREAIENSVAYRAYEEAFIISLLEKKLELEQAFKNVQTDNDHSSRSIAVKTRLVGQAMELSWDIKEYQNTGYVLRGFRKEDGFVPDNNSLTAHGMCVVETQSNGKAVQHLEAGKEYFYTFLLTRDEPVYAEQKFVESLFTSAAVRGTRTSIADTLRFPIRVPTQMEILQIERMLEKVKTPAVDPKREKINRAVEDLQSFVEFDETISQFGDTLIQQIEKSNYPEEVRNAKIERLKALLDSMLVN